MTNNKTRDEIAEARRKKRRRHRVKRLSGFLVFLLLLLVGFLILRSVTPTTFQDLGNYLSTAFEFNDNFPAELTNTLPIEARQLSRGYAVLTTSEVLTLGKNGKQHYSFIHGFSSPAMEAGNNRVLLYNRGNRELVVFNQSGELAAFSTEMPIISADISNSGVVAVLTQSELYTAELAVYERGSYTRSFTWYQASGFPLSVTIADNARSAAVVSLGTAPSGVTSTITLLDVNRMQESGAFTVDGLVLQVLLDQSGAVTLITDLAVLRCSAAGEVLARYDYSDMPLLRAEADGRGIALAFGDNNRGAINQLVCLDRSLEVKFTIDQVGVVSGLYKSRDRIYVLGETQVVAYNMKGEEVARYEADKKAIAVFGRGGGVYVVYPDHMEQSQQIKEETE